MATDGFLTAFGLKDAEKTWVSTQPTAERRRDTVRAIRLRNYLVAGAQDFGTGVQLHVKLPGLMSDNEHMAQHWAEGVFREALFPDVQPENITIGELANDAGTVLSVTLRGAAAERYRQFMARAEKNLNGTGIPALSAGR